MWWYGWCGGVGVWGCGGGFSMRSNIPRSALCATLDTYNLIFRFQLLAVYVLLVHCGECRIVVICRSLEKLKTKVARAKMLMFLSDFCKLYFAIRLEKLVSANLKLAKNRCLAKKLLSAKLIILHYLQRC
jgi:hypothetical protein